MKDLYSFDRDEAGLEESYQKMFDAYTAIFKRCGLKFRPVEADSGAIGGSGTHEFMVLAEAGEAEIVYCPKCDYAANTEIAPCQPAANPVEEAKEIEKVSTPGMNTVELLTGFLQIPAEKIIKTMFFQADNEVIAVLVRGDRTVNEIKIQQLHSLSLIHIFIGQVWRGYSRSHGGKCFKTRGYLREIELLFDQNFLESFPSSVDD